jgi:hypothetical protein
MLPALFLGPKNSLKTPPISVVLLLALEIMTGCFQSQLLNIILNNGVVEGGLPAPTIPKLTLGVMG